MYKKFTTTVVLTLAILTLVCLFPIQAKGFFNGSNTAFGNIEIPFIVNQGQVDDKIAAYAQTYNGTAFVTNDGEIIYSFLRSPNTKRGFVLKERLVNAIARHVTWEGKVSTKINYFKGNNPSGWKTNLPVYEIISFGEVYAGIVLKLKAYRNNIEKLFYIQPGANPDDISMSLEGTEGLCINKSGQLEIESGLGCILFTSPIAYQNIGDHQEFIEVSYIIEGTQYGFKVGDYNPNYELIIDPLLASTYLGGSGIDGWQYTGVIDNTIDNDGFPLVVGMTESIDFPNLEGQYECETRGNTDLFIARFNQDLTELMAVTVIGGGDDEREPKIKISENGNIYLSGQTHSSNYPTTEGTLAQTYTGNGDVVISQFDQELTTLLASTYIGGEGVEIFISLDLDNSNNVFISGVTSHDSYPTIEGSYRTFIVGSNEYFISKISPDLSTLIASTFIGGQYQERHTAMMVTPSGEVVLTGTTASPDFPTTPDAFDTTFNGLPPYSEYNNDAVVSKLDNGLTTLLASTFIGTEEYEGGFIITIDTTGSIFFGGHSESPDYPTTPGAFDEGHNGYNEFFITKMSSDLTAIEASTLLTPDQTGWNGFIFIEDLTIDESNRLVMVGATGDDYLYTTENAYDQSFNGGMEDLGIMVMTNDLTTVEYATYLGGSGRERDGTVAIGLDGDIYVASYSTSTDFPLTAGGWQPNHEGGGSDCVIARLTTNRFTRITEGPHVNDSGCSFGAGWVDYDNDNFLDLFICNWFHVNSHVNFLYHNNGDGTFSKVTDDIIGTEGYSLSVSWADYDNDGDEDAIVGNPGYNAPSDRDYFYINNGDGSFSKGTDSPVVTDTGATSTVSFVDYDNDGLLDLYKSIHCFPPCGIALGPYLYRNENFEFVKQDNGDIGFLYHDAGRAVWGDYDNDGDMDVIMGRDELRSILYINSGDGTFQPDSTNGSSSPDEVGGSYARADYDNDGDLDLFVSLYGTFTTSAICKLYQNIGGGNFIEISDTAISNNSGYWAGGSWADYDNDGDLDIFVTGQYFYEPSPNALYQNNGDGSFFRVTEGEIATDAEPSAGGIWGDYDNDGDLDLFVTNTNSFNNTLYQNNGNSNNWINIQCIGSQSNRSAIGAKIRLKATINGNEVWQLREINGQAAYSLQSRRAHFGLGDATIIDSIKIEWPSGMVDVYTDVAPNQFITYTETICGDADGNSSVNLLDITYLISYLYKGGPAPNHMQAADPDGSGTVNILDITYLIAYLYKGGSKPVCH